MLKTTTVKRPTWVRLFFLLALCSVLGLQTAQSQSPIQAADYLEGNPKQDLTYPRLLLHTETEAGAPAGYQIVRRLSPTLVIAYPQPEAQARPLIGWLDLGAAHLRWKLTPTAQQGLEAESTSWMVSGPDGAALIAILKQAGITVRYANELTRTAWITATPAQVQDVLLPSPHISFIDVPQTGIEEEVKISGHDLSTNRINYAHYQYPQYRGEDQRALIKESQFHAEDLDLVGRVDASTRASTFSSQHATLMATILAGAGNSSWEGEGVAPAARMATVGVEEVVVPEPIEFFDSIQAYLQNNSYGQGINNVYSAQAQSFDATIAANPHLLIVFSSGNQGYLNDTLGLYADIPTMANLTGNFKQANNVLVVGGTDSIYQVPFFASRGPAYDGRVKPEVVAYSPNGTSDGAALISGVGALLHQTYQTQEGTLPSSALIRATLANTADDVALAGLDYFSGYGNVHAQRAIEALHNQNYWEDTVAPGATQTFDLVVPANAREIRVALAWVDPPANAGDYKALTHDLDLSVLTPEAATVLPWVLNPSPDAATLNDPAERKRDTLNNLEQVTLTPNLAGGTYTVQVTCTECAADQAFAVQYFIDHEPEVRITHPTEDDAIIQNESFYLRWDATPEAGTADLQRSIDGGEWVTIREDLNLQREYYGLSHPTAFQQVQYRLVTGSATYTAPLSRVYPSYRPGVGLACADSILVQWAADPDATEYQVYKLGEQYMEPWFTTTDTSFFTTTGEDIGVYFAVEAQLADGVPRQKSTAIDYRLQGGVCYFRSFFTELIPTEERLNYYLTLSTTQGIERLEVFRYFEGQEVQVADLSNPASNELIIPDDDLSEGILKYVARITTTNGQQVQSDTATTLYVAPNHVRVAPNPSYVNEGISLITNFDETLTMYILNSQGKEVREIEINTYYDYLDTYELPAGIYFYYIQKGDEVYSGQIVIQ